MIFDKLPEQKNIGAPGSEERKQFINENYEKFLDEYSEALEGNSIYGYDTESSEDNIIQEAYNIDNFPEVGKCRIDIKTDEGDYVPHFHIKNKEKNRNSKKYFDGCIKLFEPEPFVHGVHSSVLTSKKSKEFLDKFLKEKDKKTNKTRWETLKDMWLDGYPDTKLPKGYPSDRAQQTQPDYSNMES